MEQCRAIVASICDAVPSGVPLVIGGDFNFTSFGERLSTEPLANEQAELVALQEFRRRGLCVAWRDTHREEPLPQTLRWRRNASTPYHSDGFLLRGIDLAAIQCEVLSSPTVAKASDHNPLVCRM